MTRTAAPLTAIRRKLALTSALGMSLGVFVTPAAAQLPSATDFGVVTGQTTNNTTIVLGNPVTPDPATIVASESVGGSGNVDTLNVTLNARNTLIEWNGFRVKSDATATFTDGRTVGAGTTQAVLNRVSGGVASALDGTINAASNIQVWVINTSGVLVGRGANINVGGLVLSGLNLATDGDFLGATNTYNVQFNSGAGTIGNSATTGLPPVIATTGGALVLVGSNINLTAATNSGTNQTAFVIASDVTMGLTPGGAMSITVAAGTSVSGTSTIAGTIVGDRVYALLKPEDAMNALLSISAPVSNATVNAQGVVVLSGGGLSATVGTDTLSTGGINGPNTAGAATVGAINFTTPTGSPAATPTTGAVTLGSTGTLNGSSVTTAGAIAITGMGDATFSGALTTTTGGLTLDRTGAVQIASLAIGGDVSVGQTTQPASFEITGTTSAANLVANAGTLTFGGLLSTTGRTSLTAGTGLVQTAGITAGTDTAAADRSVSVVGKSVNVGLVQAGTAATLTANGTVAGNRNITVAGVQAGGDVGISSDSSATTTVTAGVSTTGGNYSASGGTVAINAGTQQASGTVTLDATGGTVTVASGLTVQADGAGNSLLVGGDGTTGLALTGSTLRTTAADGTIRLTTNAAGDSFAIGNVSTTGLIGRTAATSTANSVTRTGVVSFGNLTLTGATATTIDASGSTDALDLQAIVTSNALTLKGGTGGVSFTTFGGTGNKVVTSGAGIGGTSISGAGTVNLTADAASAISITGTLGTDAANRLGTLTIDGSNGVTIGTVGATGTTAFLTNASIGQTVGTPVAALTINGGADYSGSFTSTTSGATSVGAVAGSGALTLTGLTIDGGALSTSALAGTIRLTSDTITVGAVSTTDSSADIIADRQTASTTASLTATSLSSGRDVLIGQTSPFATVTLSALSTVARNFTADATGAVALNSISTGTALEVETTGTTLTFATLSGAGSKTLKSGGSISGTAITGAGAVSLTQVTTANVGTIGATGAGVASLLLDTGDVTLGAATVTGAITSNNLTSLVANGAIDAGSIVVTTSGAQTYNSTVTSGAQTALTSTGGLVTTTGLVNAGTNTGAANRSLTVTGNSVSAGTLQAGSSITVTGNGTVAANRDVTVAGADAGTSVTISAGTLAATTVSGTVTARGGAYSASGGTLSLTGGTQQATGAVALDGGILNASSGVVVRADSDSSGGELLTVGNAATTEFHLTGSTLQGNGTGGGTVRFVSAAATTPFEIGNVTTATLQQQILAGAPADINRTGDISFGTLTLSGTNTITASGALQTGALVVGAGAPALTLNAGTAATVTGNISNLAATTGGVTVNGATVSANGSSLSGALILAATSTTAGQGVTYTTLGGSGAKTLVAPQSISGGAIAGAGAVTINPGAAGAVAITGNIGTAGTPVASLTVTRGGTVGLQGAFVTGATSLGQTAEIAGLTVGGSLDTGSLLSDSSGGSSFAAVRARTGNIDVGSSGGGIAFGGTVDGPGTLVVQAAAVSGTTFSGAVGGIQAFSSFTSNGTGKVFLNGGSLTTVTGPTGTQTYGGQLVLGADTVLTGGAATFTGGIQGNDGVRDHDLALNFSQPQTLSNAGLAGVRNLSTDAAAARR